jgi:hypothetical protein
MRRDMRGENSGKETAASVLMRKSMRGENSGNAIASLKM